jgi:hypothetical protein
MTAQPMLCAYCGTKKIWPRDFPIYYYAKCADCTKKEKND